MMHLFSLYYKLIFCN